MTLQDDVTHVFTYGSLMFDAVWSRVVTGRYRAVAGTLAGHARFAVTAQDYPGMIVDDGAGATVDGMVYRDVARGDVERLDRFEGDDYRRASVRVTCADGVARTCATYLFLPTEKLTASPWDPDAFAMVRFLATYCRDWPAP